MRIYHRHKLIATVMIALTSAFGVNAAHIEGLWKTHPGANFTSTRTQNHIVGQFHTPDCSYFLSRGQIYGPDLSQLPPDLRYGQESTLLRYDHNNPEKGLHPASYDLDLHGMNVELAAYSPQADRIFIVYADRGIDIVAADGSVTELNEFKEVAAPGKIQSFSATFDTDGRRVYLATSFGYMTFDIVAATHIETVFLGRSLFEVGRVGNKMVATATPVGESGLDPANDFSFTHGLAQIINTELYVFNPGETPVIESDTYQRVEYCKGATVVEAALSKSTGRIVHPQKLTPLSENTFMVLPYYNTVSMDIFIARINEDGTVSGTFVDKGTLNDTNSATGLKFVYKSPFNNQFSTWRDGYSVGMYNSVALIRRGVDLDTSVDNPRNDFRAKALTHISKTAAQLPGSVTSEVGYGTATWDGEQFWFYKEYKGINSRRVTLTPAANAANDPAVAWTEASEIVDLNAVATSDVMFLQWHPDYGMLARGRQCSNSQESPRVTSDLDKLCGYRDGKWTDYSHSRIRTREANDFYQLRGISPDPIDMKYIWHGSFDHGMARLNMEDPSDIVVITRERGDAIANRVPATIPFFPVQNAWNIITNICPPEFDVNGTMWFTDQNVDVNTANLYYWTADDRRACINANTDPSVFNSHPIKVIQIPGHDFTATERVYPLLAPGNENYIIYSSDHTISQEQAPFILDHNGTPDDPSDDRIAEFFGYTIDDSQAFYNGLTWLNGVFEDPTTGNVWLLTDIGILVFSPDEMLNGNKAMRILNPDNSFFPSLRIENESVTCVGIDSFGRKWLGTASSGVFCISADNSTILAHFNSENSPLESNSISAIALNCDSNSLFIATPKGMVEFFPSGTGDTNALPTAHPECILPDYNGLVRISGLNDSGSYQLIDKEGNVIRDLPAAQGGNCEWKPSTIATSSVYLIEKSNPTVHLLEIPVLSRR